jgi:predicted component of type VI protein secretion system
MKLLLEHAGDAVEVSVASLPRKGLAARFREVVFEPARWADEPTSLVVLDFDFGYKGDDVAILNELGTMSGSLQAPLVAHANASFFDFRYLVQTAALGELLPRLMDGPHAGWRTFQATEPARWVTLSVNRWLQRAPYTSAAGGHNEQCAESNPDSYLWGRSSWLVGAAVARSARQFGHGLAIAGMQGGRFDNLPSRPYPVNANTTAELSAEAAIAEQQVMELQRFGFAPVAGLLRTSTAMVVSAMTIFRVKPTRPTLEGTLAYQLMAGRLAQHCSRMLDAMPADDAATVAAFFKRELTAFIGPLAGEKPDEAVTVEVREEEIDGQKVPLAAVRVAPNVQLEGKPADFSLMLPLTK